MQYPKIQAILKDTKFSLGIFSAAEIQSLEDRITTQVDKKITLAISGMSETWKLSRGLPKRWPDEFYYFAYLRMVNTLNLIAGDGETNVLHMNTLDFPR